MKKNDRLFTHLKRYMILSFVLIGVFFLIFQSMCNYRMFSPKTTLEGELVSIDSTTWEDIDNMKYGYGNYPSTIVKLVNENNHGSIEKFSGKYRFDGAIGHDWIDCCFDDGEYYKFWYHKESRGSEVSASIQYDIFVIDAVTDMSGNTVWDAERSVFHFYDLGWFWYLVIICGGFFVSFMIYIIGNDLENPNV